MARQGWWKLPSSLAEASFARMGCHPAQKAMIDLAYILSFVQRELQDIILSFEDDNYIDMNKFMWVLPHPRAP
jgi:hypothetical protein